MVSFADPYNAISIDVDSPQKLKLEKIHGTLIILFYVSPSSPQLQRLFFFLLKTQKNPTLQQFTGGNTANLVLKRMLRYFLKIPPLKKILQFQDRKKTGKKLMQKENLCKKENFKTEIKPMIGNLQDELYQLENKQAKGAKLRANIR